MHPVTFNQPSLMDDFQIQPDVVTAVPAAAHPQLRMNFNQCEFFLLSTNIAFNNSLESTSHLGLPRKLNRRGGLSSV